MVKVNKIYYLLIAFMFLSGFLSNSHAMPVTFDIVTNNDFAGKTSGPNGDYYWEGGTNDSPLTNFYNPLSTGLNTIGSSGIFINYESFANFNFISQGFATGNTVYGGPLVFGSNSVSSVFRDAEVIGFGDGLLGIPQASPAGSNVVTINRDNTYSYTNVLSEDQNYIYSNSSLNAYSLAADQSASDIFLNSDASIFTNSDEFIDIDPQRLVNHFDYISGVVSPNWTALTFELFQYTATAKDPSLFQDFVGIGNYSYVSYDEGAVVQDPVSVPEPTSFLLMGLGLLGITYSSRRKKLI